MPGRPDLQAGELLPGKRCAAAAKGWRGERERAVSGTFGVCVKATGDASTGGGRESPAWGRGDGCKPALHQRAGQPADGRASKSTPPSPNVTRAAQIVAPHGTRHVPEEHLELQLPRPKLMPFPSRRASVDTATGTPVPCSSSFTCAAVTHCWARPSPVQVAAVPEERRHSAAPPASGVEKCIYRAEGAPFRCLAAGLPGAPRTHGGDGTKKSAAKETR